MAQRQAEEVSETRGSGLHARALTSYALRNGAVDHRLEKSPLVVGRASDSDIVLSGPLVSRRHAEFHETEAGLVVIDLDSQNGVFVNGVQITSPAALLIGDRLGIGEHEFVLTEVDATSVAQTSGPELRAPRESARVPAGSYASASDEASVATRRADALHLLGSVADKALALGRGQEAEHVLGTHLVAALSDAASGRAVAPEVARTCARYAIKLATATGKATWLDFAFLLYDALGQTIPLPIVDDDVHGAATRARDRPRATAELHRFSAGARGSAESARALRLAAARGPRTTRGLASRRLARSRTSGAMLARP